MAPLSPRGVIVVVAYVFNDDKPLVGLRNIRKDNRERAAQEIGEALAGFEKATPKHIRAAIMALPSDRARKAHPIGKYLEWNASKALETVQLDQIRIMCQVIQPVDDNGAVEAPRAFISVPKGDGEMRRYFKHTDLQTSETAQIRLWKQALKEIEAFTERFKMLHELTPYAQKMAELARERIAAMLREDGGPMPPPRPDEGDGDRPPLS